MTKRFVKKSDSPKRASEMGDIVTPKKKISKKEKACPKPKAEEEIETDSDIEIEDEVVDFDVNSEASRIMEEASKTSASYQIQIRVPAEIEPIYKSLSPKVRKALKNAFVQLINKAAGK